MPCSDLLLIDGFLHRKKKQHRIAPQSASSYQRRTQVKLMNPVSDQTELLKCFLRLSFVVRCYARLKGSFLTAHLQLPNCPKVYRSAPSVTQARSTQDMQTDLPKCITSLMYHEVPPEKSPPFKRFVISRGPPLSQIRQKASSNTRKMLFKK
jgi:hypothetical protein